MGRTSLLSAAALALVATAGCTHSPTQYMKPDPAMEVNTRKHPHEVYFQGLIFHYAPYEHVMSFVMGNSVKTLNQVEGTYNARTKIYIDNKPGALANIRQYMPAQVRGRETRTKSGRPELLLQVVKFSSKIPRSIPH
jgi:hypothetical protein